MASWTVGGRRVVLLVHPSELAPETDLSEAYYKALTKLGAKLTRIVLGGTPRVNL